MSTISSEYKGLKEDFEFHHRPLWECIVSQVEDPKLTPYFAWDAHRLSRWNGQEWVRIYEEPSSADMFWEVQVSASYSGFWIISHESFSAARLIL